MASKCKVILEVDVEEGAMIMDFVKEIGRTAQDDQLYPKINNPEVQYHEDIDK